jgi:hypothetical protein
MHTDFPHKRPNCVEILEKKNSWALNREELQINDELKKELIPKLDDENQIVHFIFNGRLYHLLKSKLKI